MTEKPKKRRISTVAKSYDVPSDLLVRLLKETGAVIKSAASTIDAETFTKVKPALIREKELIDRKELAKAGKKIPMKAVLKKAAIITRPAPPKAEIVKPEVPEVKKENKQAVADTVDIPSVANEIKPIAEDKSQPVKEPVEKTAEVPSSATPAEAEPVKAETPVSDVMPEVQEPPKAPSAKITIEDIPQTEQKLKVTVEKPDAKLQARVEKYITEQSEKRVNQRPGSQGYSGRFGRVPSVLKSKKKETSPTDKPRDIYAQRAQEAGVFTSLDAAKPEAPKDQQFQQKRVHGKGKRKKSKQQVEQELSDLRTNVNKVMVTLSRGSQKNKYKKDKIEEEESDERKTLKVAEFITIGELAALMKVQANQVIAKCMELGIMVTINQRLDHETIGIISDEFGFDSQLMEEYTEEIQEVDQDESESDLITRAPVVTVMGHVDHGKTSILDYIRKTNIVSGESGGITQHVGAYSFETDHGPVCFLDTPGHAAFSAMRARGAQVTDVVVLVVAADSMVMPQTKEAIQHSKNANVKIVVAINKCDLPDSNPDKIRAQLAEEGVSVEGWGGEVSCVEVSAKTGKNIDKLMEILALEAEVMELKANPNKPAKGTVIEARLDKGKGTVATVLIQEGTIKVGDPFVCGSYAGRVRSLLDDRGKRKDSAGPSTPVQIMGFEGTPQAGDTFSWVANEREGREVASRRREAAKDRELRQKQHITLDQLHEQIESGEFHELKVIIKGDVDGSVEAIATSLENLSTPEVKVNIISKGVGAVKDADIHLAAASEAIIVAFHVLPSDSVRVLAENEGVTINYYRIIYEVVDEIREAMEGLLSPDYREEVIGEARILQLFKVPKIGMIAGCVVTSGYVDRESKVRLYRSGIEVSETKVSSLKRVKDDAKSVKSGLECGIGLDVSNDIQVDDVLAFFKKIKVARKLTVKDSRQTA